MAEKKKLRASPAVKETSRGGGRGTAQGREGDTRAETRAVPKKAQRHADEKHEQQQQKQQKQPQGQSGTKAQQPAAMKEPAPPYPQQHQAHPGIEAEIEPRPRYEAPAYRAAGKLEGKTALITGADSGIGRAVAVLYAREGADVGIVYLPQEEEDARETQRAVEQEGRRALLIPGDVTDPEFCENSVERVLQEFGKLDILVNNAGFQQHQESIEDISYDQWDLTFRTNIFGYFYMSKAAVPHLKRGSAIVNTGSVTGIEGSKGLLDYSATKGAIHAFTKSLAQMLVDKGIRVNCVAPGPVWTPLNVVDKPPEKASKHGATTPMHRPAQPEEIAPAYVFFASEPDSSYVTGDVLPLLGGETV
ncbi:MAG TPA: SDR family oxidoreductase [Gemmatimonadaceae bacterium]|nr:SDR family oxidoreductase [Gemmatimonadaceae bacterium]